MESPPIVVNPCAVLALMAHTVRLGGLSYSRSSRQETILLFGE